MVTFLVDRNKFFSKEIFIVRDLFRLVEANCISLTVKIGRISFTKIKIGKCLILQ